jgi:hypothetical protein
LLGCENEDWREFGGREEENGEKRRTLPIKRAVSFAQHLLDPLRRPLCPFVPLEGVLLQAEKVWEQIRDEGGRRMRREGER